MVLNNWSKYILLNNWVIFVKFLFFSLFTRLNAFVAKRPKIIDELTELVPRKDAKWNSSQLYDMEPLMKNINVNLN